jgi:lysozyme
LGVTNASGHQVYPRYKDKPQTIQHCFDVSVWLMQEKYLPPILKAYPELNEAQLAAALSFHWNTGKFPRYANDFSKAVEIRNKGALDARRKREQDLWYKGVWPKSLMTPIYPVSSKYNPIFNKATLVDPTPYLKNALS